jgi:hypothetical protein
LFDESGVAVSTGLSTMKVGWRQRS